MEKLDFKIGVFIDSGWSLGQLYKSIVPYINGELIPWDKSYDKGRFSQYDRVLTLAGSGSWYLENSYNIPKEKIIIVAHAEEDLQKMLATESPEEIFRYAGFGVISDSLANVSLSLGIKRIPVVLRQGVDTSFYKSSPPSQLKSVGYAAKISRFNKYGVEIKRGELVKRVCEKVGLKFRLAENFILDKKECPRELMPSFYRSVDCVVLSSLQEGGAMPPYEAASAGRLVIGTPVGDFPRLCYEGLGILAPLNEMSFMKFLEETFLYYKEEPSLFNEKCQLIQKAAINRVDWSCVIQDWIQFINDSMFGAKS
jgi:glycosyltransferase involved in cell wall biosynthesis